MNALLVYKNIFKTKANIMKKTLRKIVKTKRIREKSLDFKQTECNFFNKYITV